MSVHGTIDLDALEHNLGIARQCAPNSRLMAVVKSEAYGHGMVQVARRLRSAADAFAVSTIDEAVELRSAAISMPVCSLTGFSEPAQLAAARRYGIQAVVHCDEQVDMLAADQGGDEISVWLKINTGMNRLGFAAERVAAVMERLHGMPGVSQVRLMSHLASADLLDEPATNRQIDGFLSVSKRYSCETSLANSAAVMKHPRSHLDWVRPGIMLYGASPVVGMSAAELGLRPVMSVRARIIAINDVSPGEAVGYGGKWISAARSRIGTLACGYADGYRRSAFSCAEVLVAGRPASVVGNVSMNLMAIDLTDHPDVEPDAEITLVGDGLPVERLAEAAGTNSYEVLTGFTRVAERFAVIDAAGSADSQ